MFQVSNLWVQTVRDRCTIQHNNSHMKVGEVKKHLLPLHCLSCHDSDIYKRSSSRPKPHVSASNCFSSSINVLYKMRFDISPVSGVECKGVEGDVHSCTKQRQLIFDKDLKFSKNLRMRMEIKDDSIIIIQNIVKHPHRTQIKRNCLFIAPH